MNKQTLIIDGIDWLDPRVIGLKCIFSDDDLHYEQIGCLAEVSDDGYFRRADTEFWYNECRLAQGEKTLHDGSERSPVPTGVEVEVWDLTSSCGMTKVLEGDDWSFITAYQIQEQLAAKQEIPPEHVCSLCYHDKSRCHSCTGEDCEGKKDQKLVVEQEELKRDSPDVTKLYDVISSFLNNNKSEPQGYVGCSLCDEKIIGNPDYHRCKGLRISNKLRDRIVGCLVKSRNTINLANRLLETNDIPLKINKEETAEIGNILQELGVSDECG